MVRGNLSVPLLVRLSATTHPDFDLQSFADPSTGAITFFDENNRELSFQIDEWNASINHLGRSP